ncbi:MAG: hypothetical protein AUF61_02925 [Chloroflexi bacterium 13_1_20CM_66_33]|nr:MAG: hypothetical protein AUF61_02925 [Chloroflexi bacterium 13_1_20CM_66_33]TMF44065.1 MAG: hypothetical protein E6I24_11160 [Chloroflexota bacterium]TMG11787.1 MAG: hypothetical protein E6I01_13205 [Chloroflexota bacterium]TMG20087.1 MAG: hypothetical protein E6H98_01070 [Chloroflexota bacterium]
MPGPIVNMGGTVTCMHGGQGQCTTVSPKVMVGNQPVVTIPASYMVAGCAFPPPPAANGPCVTGMIPSGSTKVLVGGMPVLLAVPPVAGTCVPTGTPMMIAYAGQAKVIAQ